MKNKRLSELLTAINVIKHIGSNDSGISSLVYDSRDVTNGSLFFALKGIHTDGHKYISKAISSGASAVIHSDDLNNYDDNIDYIKVKNCREAMSPISSAFYDFPSTKLRVIGVTGTDGKSSTVSMIHQLLEFCGKKTGFISTVNYKSGDCISKSPIRQSTPEAPTIHKLLGEMVENHMEYAVVESTSHGLSPKTSRLADVNFNGAVLTNVTHEHLEFHGSLEQYRDDKANLFRMAKDFAVINYDDENHELFENAAGDIKKLSYSTINSDCRLFAHHAVPDKKGTDFQLNMEGREFNVRLNVPGLVNIENIMAAIGAVLSISDIPVEKIIKVIPRLKSVKGRMALIEGSQPFDIYVDYAHTPGSYKKVFPLFRKAAKGKLITLFGSAGERDVEKRSVQGEIAALFSDIIILTDEDPRLEDSISILKEIAVGITNKQEGADLFLISDRTSAIRKALELAGPGDMVVTLGKGHETSIEYADGHHPWDEMSVVESILEEMNYR